MSLFRQRHSGAAKIKRRDIAIYSTGQGAAAAIFKMQSANGALDIGKYE
jgi:hypothetical protein